MVGETGTEVLPKPYVSDCVERPVVSIWRQRQQQVVRIQVEQEAARFKAGQGGDYGCRQVERISGCSASVITWCSCLAPPSDQVTEVADVKISGC
jgi:hypothetical protein